MKLVTVNIEGIEQAGIAFSQGIVLIDTINRMTHANWPVEMFDLLQSGQWRKLNEWYRQEGETVVSAAEWIAYDQARLAPLYRHPRKIWGIGFNYVKDEKELASVEPDVEPVGFMKPDTALIGPGDTIQIPPQSKRTIAEAEMAIVIGETCKDVSEEDAHHYVAGFTTILDMAADDIHQKNPRYLARAKSFDTFFSFGSQLVTADEWSDILDMKVYSVLNGEVVHQNVVRNMRFRPWFAVSFHSKVMTLLPGDVIMTGTPGAVVIRDGDVVECRIDGLLPLSNPVKGS